MTFTDKDLSDFKLVCADPQYENLTLSRKSMKAILDRLEAAENIVRLVRYYSNDSEDIVPIKDAIAEWRKAKGE